MSKLLEIGRCDVAVIGSGPSGLAAATMLRQQGIEKVLVLDREAEPGGVPRHCGHPPFGIVEYARIMRGPSYARHLAGTALKAGVEISLKSSVTSLEPGGVLDVVSPAGSATLKARRVLLATGARETPRSARLVSGGRMLGISTTGALQSMVYLKNMVPFRRPVVVGTEIVSFSALMTCRKAGIKPVAMIEEKSSASLKWPLCHSARIFGVPLCMKSQITGIMGKERVESVRIEDAAGNIRDIDCDGVLFTGRFVPEASLARMSHLEVDPGSGCLVLDRYGRASDPAYYAAGNLLGSANISFKCWQNGKRTGARIAGDLKNQG